MQARVLFVSMGTSFVGDPTAMANLDMEVLHTITQIRMERLQFKTLMFDCGPQIQILMEQSTFGMMMMMMMVYWILTMISVLMNVHHWIQTMMVCQIQLSHHVLLLLLRI